MTHDYQKDAERLKEISVKLTELHVLLRDARRDGLTVKLSVIDHETMAGDQSFFAVHLSRQIGRIG